MKTSNIWLGANELVIVFRSGTHFVIEKYEDWQDVYQGTYAQCVKYCENRSLEYEESIIG